MTVQQTSNVGELLGQQGVTLKNVPQPAPALRVTNQPNGVPLATPIQGTSPSVQGVVPKDLSANFANVNGTIYNKQTNQPLSKDAFFKAAGVDNFNGLTFDTKYKPPTGINKDQSTMHAQLTAANLGDNMSNSSAARAAVSSTLAAPPEPATLSQTPDANGNIIDAQGNLVHVGPTADQLGLIPSNAAYDTQTTLSGLLSKANDAITQLTDPNKFKPLADVYNNLRTSLGLPALEGQISSITGAIAGSPDDIKAELKNSGALVTDSESFYLAGQRNEVLFKQLDALNSLYSMQNDYVNQVVNLTGQDQQSAITRFQDAFNIGESALQVQDALKQENIQQNLTARDFALANGIKKPFYAVGGTVFQTSTGLAAKDHAQYVAMGGKGDFSDTQEVSSPLSPNNLQAVQWTDSNGNVVKGFINLSNGQLINPETLAGASAGASAPAGVISAPNGSYDLSSYASNPAYPSEINSLVQKINASSPTGEINSAADAQNYIDSTKPNSPITGDMVMQAAQKYGVDPSVMLAIMQQESQLGTDGSKGARENNFGNVGNTDSLMASGGSVRLASAQTGVDAVASWLSKHPATNSAVPTGPLDPGYATDIVPNSGGLTQAYIDAAAKYLNATSQMMGGSRATTGKGGMQSTAIKNRAAQLLNGGSIAANQQAFTYGKSTQAQGTIAAVSAAVQDANYLKQLSSLVPRGSFTITNAATLEIKAKTSDPNTAAFIAAVSGYADDIGAALGGGVATDAKLKLGQTLANPNYSDAAFGAALDSTVVLLQNRANAIKAQANIGQTGSTPESYLTSLGVGSGSTPADHYIDSLNIGASLQ